MNVSVQFNSQATLSPQTESPDFYRRLDGL